jgi:tRNA-specific 2-thiouridylase
MNKWVNREKFLNITGRSRKEQLKLTKDLKIIDYACPSGGCLLTDKYYGLKMKDLINADMFNIDNIKFFSHGRYFSITEKFKLIVGRNESENKIIKSCIKANDIIFIPKCKGPIAAGRGIFNESDIIKAAEICAFYCKSAGDEIVFDIQILPDFNKQISVKKKLYPEQIRKYALA